MGIGHELGPIPIFEVSLSISAKKKILENFYPRLKLGEQGNSTPKCLLALSVQKSKHISTYSP